MQYSFSHSPWYQAILLGGDICLRDLCLHLKYKGDFISSTHNVKNQLERLKTVPTLCWSTTDNTITGVAMAQVVAWSSSGSIPDTYSLRVKVSLSNMLNSKLSNSHTVISNDTKEVLLSGMNWMRRRTPPPMTRNVNRRDLLWHFFSSQVETT